MKRVNISPIKENEKARREFVNGVLAAARAEGVGLLKLEQECFNCESTGRNRLVKNIGILNLTDLCNIACVSGLSLRELVIKAAENIHERKR